MQSHIEISGMYRRICLLVVTGLIALGSSIIAQQFPPQRLWTGFTSAAGLEYARMSPSGRYVVAHITNGTNYLWDLDQKTYLGSYVTRAYRFDVDFGYNDALLVFNGSSGELVVVDLETRASDTISTGMRSIYGIHAGERHPWLLIERDHTHYKTLYDYEAQAMISEENFAADPQAPHGFLRGDSLIYIIYPDKIRLFNPANFYPFPMDFQDFRGHTMESFGWESNTGLYFGTHADPALAIWDDDELLRSIPQPDKHYLIATDAGIGMVLAAWYDIHSQTPHLGFIDVFLGTTYVDIIPHSQYLINQLLLTNGNQLGVVQGRRSLDIYDWYTLEFQEQLYHHTGSYIGSAMNTDLELLALFTEFENSSVPEMVIRLYDLNNGDIVSRKDLPLEQYTGFAMSRDTSRVAVAIDSSFIRVYDGTDFTIPLMEIEVAENYHPAKLAFTIDGKTLLVCGGSGDIIAYDVATAQGNTIYSRSFKTVGPCTGITVSDDGSHFAAHTADSTGGWIELFRYDQHTPWRTFPGSAVTFLPDDRSILIRHTSSLELWDMVAQSMTYRTEDLGKELIGAGVHLESGTLFGVANDGSWYMFEPGTTQPVDSVRLYDADAVLAHFTTTGQYATVFYSDASIQTYTIDSLTTTHVCAPANPESVALHSIHPNPARETIAVQLTAVGAAPVILSVYDNLGRECAHRTIAPEASLIRTEQFQTAGWQPGTYHIVMRSGNRQSVKSFVVME